MQTVWTVASGIAFVGGILFVAKVGIDPRFVGPWMLFLLGCVFAGLRYLHAISDKIGT